MNNEYNGVKAAIWIVLLIVLALLALVMIANMPSCKSLPPPPPRTDVTVITRANPAAQIMLQPGVDHYVVFKKPGSTIVGDVPFVIQAVDAAGNPISKEVLHSNDGIKRSAESFGFSPTHIRVRLAAGVPTPSPVWVRPD